MAWVGVIMCKSELGAEKPDDAQDAGWLYDIARNTTEEIATIFGFYVTRVIVWSLS